MLIDIVYTLRSAELPVSVTEYLTLVEALKEGVVGPQSDGAWSLEDFYYLSRIALVPEEKHYGVNPQGIRSGQDKSRSKSAVKVWDQRAYKDSDDRQDHELSRVRES